MLLLTNVDANTYRLNTNAPFQRAYWRGIKDAVNGPMQSSNYTAVLDGNYAALNANGLTVKTPTESVNSNLSLVGWIEARRNYLSNQLNSVAALFEISNNGGNNFTTNLSGIALTGKAPIEVATLQATRVNGTNTVIYSSGLTNWTTVTNWSMAVGLTNGANTFNVQGYDRLGAALGGAFDSITITK